MINSFSSLIAIAFQHSIRGFSALGSAGQGIPGGFLCGFRIACQDALAGFPVRICRLIHWRLPRMDWMPGSISLGEQLVNDQDCLP